MKYRIHVNQHNIRANHKDGGNRPVLTCKNYKKLREENERLKHANKFLRDGSKALLESKGEAYDIIFMENERLKKLVEDYKHKLFNVADPYADKLEKENERLKARNAELVKALRLHGHDNRINPNCDMCKALTKTEEE